MGAKLKEYYKKWKYMGFTQEELIEHGIGIAKENLKMLQIALVTVMLILLILWGILQMAISISPKTTYGIHKSIDIIFIAMVLVMLQIIFLYVARKNKLMKIVTISRISTTLFLSTINLAAMTAEVVFYPDAYATITCGLLMVSQITFVAFPRDNLIYITCLSILFTSMNIIFKPSEIYIYDLIDSIPFLIFGIALSWKKSQYRWKILILTKKEKEMELRDLQNKLKESRIDIMLSQIQPHFLYNTLEGIGELCHSDPAYAQKAVTEFACYLRGNLDVLGDQRIIPFKNELEHIKHYLYCEKMRFGDRIQIVYDIKATDFSVPTLSLQPIVENAVRYGIFKKEDGGVITIKSREEDTCDRDHG